MRFRVETPHGDKFMCQYQKFNLSLTRWYCGISENLETLILDHPVHHIYLTNLIQSCPKLKNLQIAHYTNAYNPTSKCTDSQMIYLMDLYQQMR